MKRLFFLSVLALSFASCKKQNNTPAPVNNNSSTNNNGNTTNTTNDTIGKFKAYFKLDLERIYTHPDSIIDTAKINIYHNGTRLNFSELFYSNDSLGVQLTMNYNGAAVNHPQSSPKPVWMAHGDSLIAELVKLEYTYSNLSQVVALNNHFYVFDGTKPCTSGSQVNGVTYFYPTILPNDTYLGAGTTVGGNVNYPSVYLSLTKKRAVYIYP